jgi:hypothetical protein
VTVPHGLRSSHQRAEAVRALVEEAVATTDGTRYREILASVEPVDWYGFCCQLVLRVRVPIVPEHVAHRHAKARALAQEDQRRRLADRAAPE